MAPFTFEETNLLCIYMSPSKQKVLQDLTQMYENLDEDEVELLELTDSVITKLERLSDEEFTTLKLFPEF